MKTAISVIIPVYNAEKYLDRCLKSVLGALNFGSEAEQRRSSAGTRGEIVLVDNGSTDGSSSILEKYATELPEVVRVLQCTTPGAAATRNLGMREARGEYVWFVDADDTVAETAISRLLEAAEGPSDDGDGSASGSKSSRGGSRGSSGEKADLVMMGMERIYADEHKDYLSAVNTSLPGWQSRWVRYGMGPVQVLIRREWWLRNELAFYEGIIHEDMELMSALVLYTEKIAFVDKPLYFYYQNKGSVLHKEAWDPHYFDIFEALSSLRTRFEEAGAFSKYHAELEWFFIWNLLIDSAKDFKKFPEGREGLAFSRKTMRAYFPKWRKNRFLRQKSWKLRLKVRMNFWGI